MTRGGQKNLQDEPERKCIVSGLSQPREGLVRFCIGPDLTVVPDVAQKLPGRGIYVSANRAAIDKASTKGLFSRAARTAVKAPEGLSDLVESLLARRVVDLISLARKAGEAVTGFEKVKGWLVKGQGVVLLQANDGSERGKEKLYPPKGEQSFIGCLSAGELGLAFGRDRAIHAALSAGGLTDRIVEEAARLIGLRGSQTDEDAIGGISAGKETKDA